MTSNMCVTTKIVTIQSQHTLLRLTTSFERATPFGVGLAWAVVLECRSCGFFDFFDGLASPLVSGFGEVDCIETSDVTCLDTL